VSDISATVTSQPISTTVTSSGASATVTSSSSTVSVGGGVGPQGPAGVSNVPGPAGPQGVQGVPGVAGSKGDRGDVGPAGPAGADGLPGVAGQQGIPGAAGAAGAKGDQGDVGPPGPAGSVGATGAQGIQGPAGVAGATGPQGPAGSAASATTDASLLTSGTLADARLSETVTAALTNSRTPTVHASSHATGGSDAITPASIGAAAASHVHSAADITSGTLADARISSSFPTWATLATSQNQPASTLDVFPRGECTTLNSGGSSGQIFFVFFTPSVSFTVSAITYCSGTIAGSGLTLARMGLYTFDETTVTLVARTASDTTLFTSTNTAYTRSLATAGGFPATYTLNAGTRYGVAVIAVGTTAPNYAGRTNATAVGGLTPRVSASLPSQTDLVTSGTPANAQANIYARLT
jgi:hypothetical protein